MPSATLLLAFVLLLQVAACRPSSSSLGDDRSGRSLLRVAAWPWYSSHRLPVSSSSSWNAFSLPVAARLGAAPLRVAPVAAPVAAPAWELPRVVAPIAQKQAASDYYMVSLASPASGVSHLVRYELATPLPATPHPATPHPATPHPATPSWLRLYGTPLYDMVESVQSAARPHLIINRAATRRGPPSPTWVPSPSPASPVAAVQRGDRPQDGATGPAAGTTPSAQHTKATTDVSEAGSTVYVFTTSAVAATDDAPHDAASGVATLSAWDDQWTSNSAVSGVQPTVETTVATRQPVFETSIATHEPTETTAATHQPVFETSIATHEPTETTAATHQLTETSVVPTWPAATTIVTTDIGETTATAYKTAETTAATHQPAETAVTTDVAETTAATPNRIDTTAAPSKWSETTAWPERTETTAALLLEQAVTTVAVEVPVFTTNISLSVNLVTEPVEVVTTGNFDPESTPAVTATETTFPWSEPALTADQTDSVTVISVSATDVPLMTTFQPAYNGSVTTDLLDPATAAFTNEPVVTTELPSDVGSSVTTTQPEDEEAETVTSQSSTVSFVSTDSDLPTSYDLDTIEIEINRRTVAPATTDFPDGAPSTTAAPTTTEAYSSLEAEDSTPSWTPTDVTDADQSEEPATDAAYSSSPAPEVFSTTSATTEVVSTTSAPTETVSTASALPEDVSTYTESIGTTTAEAGSGVWTEDAMTSDPAAVGYTASTDGFSTASFSTTMADASTTVSSEATTTAGATPTEASTYLVDVLTTSPADVDPTALEMTASAPQATFPWSTDTTPQTLTVMTYPLPGTSKSPFVAPLTLRPTSAPVTDFNYYDGVAFDDGVVVGGGSPADSYIPDYDSRVDEYDGDYFADAAERQRPPLSPPLTSDTKGLEIASLVRETPPAPDSHRRSDVLPEDDVDDESNEVGSASTAWSSTPRPAATTHKYGDSFEGQMLRRMVPLVVRQLRLGHLSAEDTVRLRYIFGPIWPEVEQMARAVEAGRGRRDAGRYPHYKKWTGDAKPGEGGSSRRGGHVRRPAHGPARRRPQKHNKGAGHKRGPKRGHKGDGHRTQDARLDTHRQPKHAVHRRHHPHHAEDHQVRPKRDLSPEDDAADDEDYYREDNDEDYVVDHHDDYDADEEEEEGDDEDEDEGFDSPSVMELHFRGMQGEGPLGRRRRPARRRVHG